MRAWLVLAILVFSGCAQNQFRPAAGEMARLLKEADTDGDKKITVHDRPTTFILRCHCGRELPVTGAYPLSNLLQELADGKTRIEPGQIFENPVHRLSRLIRERYWENLTRTISPDNFLIVAADPKLPGQKPFLYIPDRDVFAKQVFKGKNFVALPDQVNADYFKSIRERHGLLYLPKPYVVPGGRFNEMYGWDSYFESLGLLKDGRADLAIAMADNFIYEIENYGKILNGNRTYYLNRSQPPFLTSLIIALGPYTNSDWRRRAVAAAIKEYNQVWMSAERLTSTGLSRYFGSDFGVPPEVEKGHFDDLLGPAARRHRLSVEQLIAHYNGGRLRDPAVAEILAHDRAVRESGHDTTYRWKVKDEDRAADFVTVDLNALLFKFEIDLAKLTGDGVWKDRAARRKDLMMKYMWDEEREIFFDYNWREGYRSSFVSATGFYPLWAGLLDEKRARASAQALLIRLEAPGGLLSDDEASLKAVHAGSKPRQWDFPNGWAPHQMLAWEGLKNYGMNEAAQRLIYKWLYMITKNAADYNGTVPEKFDVMKRSHAVFAEYGNVGTDFAYITREGFGWMNASYQVGLAELKPELRKQLEKLVPPENLERLP